MEGPRRAIERTAGRYVGEASPGCRVRVGVDLVEVDRILRLLTRYASAERRLFTRRELEHCRGMRRRHVHLAARFAAKEAVLKAFGTGLAGGMRWVDVEVLNDDGGRPFVRLHGAAASLARRRRLAALDVSLADAAGLAIAQAVAVWDDGSATP